MKRLVSVVLASLWLAPGLGLAQQIPKDALLPTETRYLNSPSASQYPGCNAVFLSDQVTFSVQPGGGTVYDEHDVIKVFTPAGVEEHKDLMRVYRSDLEKVEVVRARTILPDGRVLEIPPQAIADEPVFENNESKANLSMRRLLIRYPAVAPNCIVEFHLRTEKKTYPGAKWWAVSYVQNPDPMVESTFCLEVPTGSNWRYATPGYGNMAPEKTVVGEVERATWKITQSPAMTQEAAGPPLLTQMKRIEVSNFESWGQFRSWFEQAFESATELDPSLTAQWQKLVTAGSSPGEQLTAVGAWASRKRFLGGGLDDFRPIKAGMLVDEKVLNPVDAAVLLTGLYRAGGFTVQPVLAFEAPPESILAALPRFNRVDNLILRVSLGTQSWWIDPRHPLEFDPNPPSGLQGGSALIGSEDQPLEPLAVTAADANRVETQVEARLDEKGKLELRFNTTEHGASGSAYREASRELLESDKDARDQKLNRLFDRIAAGYGSRARVLDHYFNMDARQGQPIDFAATLSVPDYCLRLGDKLALPMPVRINAQLAGLAQSEGPRTQPVRLDHPWREECRMRLHIPANTEISELPKTVNLSSPYGSFYATARGKGREVYYYSRLVVNQAWVAPEKSAELAQFARQVMDSRGRLVLSPTGKTATQ